MDTHAGLFRPIHGARGLGTTPRISGIAICCMSCDVTKKGWCLQAMALVDFAKRTHQEPEAVRPLKRYALKWHMALGAALTAGFAAARVPAAAIFLTFTWSLTQFYTALWPF